MFNRSKVMATASVQRRKASRALAGCSILFLAALYVSAAVIWTPTGNLGTIRDSHTATMLPNGKVLVIGGVMNANGATSTLSSAELYDPVSATWTPTGSMVTARQQHTATLLANGKVLVVGGTNTGTALASAELYDPATGTWTTTGNLRTARKNHSATILPNGKVLVVGGWTTSFFDSETSLAELYDPSLGSWSPTGSLHLPRTIHTATLLSSGKVLVAGGFVYTGVTSTRATTTELYDPASETWTLTGNIVTPRSGHTATLLPNGKVLVVGGRTGSSGGNTANVSELYDPQSGAWSATGNLITSRSSHTATLLSSGKVLVAGGEGLNQSSTELYDPALGTWRQRGNLYTGRSSHTATLLPNDKVLVAGGYNSDVNSTLNSSELYDQDATFSMIRGAADFDGDGKTDESVFRPSNNYWYLNRSQAGYKYLQFGADGDIPVAADFTGDRKADLAVFRPSTGNWYILFSESNTLQTVKFGMAGDVPVPGDFDGEGRANVAVYRPSEGRWYLGQTGTGSGAINFGIAEDKPTLGDFDGDGKTDIAVFRPSTGVWYRLNSSDGSFFAIQFGQTGDKVVAADYTGDGKTDLAVWRPSNGTWYVLRSEDGSFYGQQFGLSDDLPTPGDYDGDGKADVAVFRPSNGTWFEQRSTSGFTAVQFGMNGDKPVSNAFVY